MSQRNKHADVIIAWANGEEIQVKPHGRDYFVDWKEFFEGRQSPVWYDDMEYRIKPRTITIGGIEVPAPITEPPADGTAIFISVLSAENLYVEMTWANVSPQGENVLRRGIVHLTASDAFEHSKALIAVSGGRVE